MHRAQVAPWLGGGSPKADIRQRVEHVRFVPIADIRLRQPTAPQFVRITAWVISTLEPHINGGGG